MRERFILEYAKKVTREDIINFGYSQGINLTDSEVNVIEYYIKNDMRRILNNPEEIFMEVRDKLGNKTYQKMVELYNKYKDKIY